jgi:hypothetical protein
VTQVPFFTRSEISAGTRSVPGTFSKDELSGYGARLPGGMAVRITRLLPKDAAERGNASNKLGLSYKEARYSQDCPLRLGVTKGQKRSHKSVWRSSRSSFCHDEIESVASRCQSIFAFPISFLSYFSGTGLKRFRMVASFASSLAARETSSGQTPTFSLPRCGSVMMSRTGSRLSRRRRESDGGSEPASPFRRLRLSLSGAPSQSMP